MSSEAHAVVALSDELLDEIARRAAALVARADAQTEPWLNHQQAAAHLAVSASQLYTLVSQRHANELPVHKEGNRSYFRASELDTWRQNR